MFSRLSVFIQEGKLNLNRRAFRSADYWTHITLFVDL